MTPMMDPHYFLSKGDILGEGKLKTKKSEENAPWVVTCFCPYSPMPGWLNDTLGTRIQKVEDTASGAVACQIMDALHPGMVPIKKVDFNAKNE